VNVRIMRLTRSIPVFLRANKNAVTTHVINVMMNLLEQLKFVYQLRMEMNVLWLQDQKTAGICTPRFANGVHREYVHQKSRAIIKVPALSSTVSKTDHLLV